MKYLGTSAAGTYRNEFMISEKMPAKFLKVEAFPTPVSHKYLHKGSVG